MSSSVQSNPNSVSRGSNPPSNLPLVTIHTSNQLPYKLIASNYHSWHAMFITILFGYDLMGYLDGTIPCPFTPTATTPTADVARYAHWYRQGQLLLNLKEDLTLIEWGSRMGSEFLHVVKVIADELSLIDAPILDDDLTLYVLNGLDGNASTLVVTTNSSQRELSNGQFKNNKSHSKQNSNNKSGFKKSPVVCQICDQFGHSAKTCAKLQSRPAANYASSTTLTNGKWLLESVASHNITSDLANLSIHSEYEGQDGVVLGDGTGSNDGSSAHVRQV
ncbi:hypothetical protein F2P56_024334 [Juglans regia]|uniref:Retrotransposon Copia-like N-terminal domain-containing protein n=1 Tax=Juglans regia TaxID=51240 RepID=A0A833X0L9_JUGRE|nr:hypothetical protein F2P56_024334 [Juglans regia]